jgi:hypothetical protein
MLKKLLLVLVCSILAVTAGLQPRPAEACDGEAACGPEYICCNEDCQQQYASGTPERNSCEVACARAYTRCAIDHCS